MKTSTVMTLSLCLLYLCISNSQSLSSIETCNCESWDEVCWDNCLSESRPFPCALIKTCQKHPEHALCKDVPTTIPSRCGDRRLITTSRPGPTKPSGNVCFKKGLGWMTLF